MGITYDVAGHGPPVVLLPAVSTVSTRAEMGALAHRLERQFRTATVGWPPFGSPRRSLRTWLAENTSGKALQFMLLRSCFTRCSLAKPSRHPERRARQARVHLVASTSRRQHLPQAQLLSDRLVHRA